MDRVNVDIDADSTVFHGREERGTIINKLFPDSNAMFPLAGKQKMTGEAGRDKGVPLNVPRQVEALILAAMDNKNLSQMYSGWAPYL